MVGFLPLIADCLRFGKSMRFVRHKIVIRSNIFLFNCGALIQCITERAGGGGGRDPDQPLPPCRHTEGSGAPTLYNLAEKRDIERVAETRAAQA